MTALDFNANEVEPSKEFQPLPPGKYPAVISDSALKPNSKNTGSFLELTFAVIEGEYKNRKVWVRLNIRHPNPDTVRMANADLSAICHAVKVYQLQHSSQLHNLPLFIKVTCKPRSDGNGLQNDVSAYEALDAGGAADGPATAPEAATGTTTPATGAATAAPTGATSTPAWTR